MSRFCSTTLLLIFFATAAIFAQGRTIKVLGVSVTGNASTDANMIRMQSGIMVGSDLSAEGVQDAIRKLWRLNLFSDIQLLVDRQVGDGYYLTIQVQEYPRLEKVELQGHKKLKKDDIDEILNYYSGQIVSPTSISRSKTKLLEKYKEKGHLLADIDVEQTPGTLDSNRVIVRFIFSEGKKVQVERIRFFGNTAFNDNKLRKQLKEIKEDKWWRSADFDREKYEEDLLKIIEFYNNEGYRDAEIVSDSVYYNDDQDDMFIDITVNEGAQYYFGDISFSGNKVFTDEELAANLRFKKGDVYSKKSLDEASYQHIGGLYYDLGYIFASATPRETVNAANPQQLDIQFLMQEGKQAKIDEILISGNTKTKEKVIRRELHIIPGQTFNKSLLERSQREVWMLNYFANVEPGVKPIDEEKVNLEFKVEEKSTDTANMSAGWSERDRLIGSVGVAMANLLGNGQRLSFDWSFGRYYRSFNIGFTEPWLLDTPTLAGFSFYDTKRDAYYIGYRQVSTGASFRLGRRFNWPDNFFRGDWIYRIDKTELSDFNAYIIAANPNNIINEEWPLISSSVTQIFSRNSLDRPEFPTSGSEVSLTTQLTGTFLGGNVDYHKWIFRLDWFTPSFWKLVFYSSFQAGYMESIGANAHIPYTDYFFMGGDGLSNSTPLRGYEDPLANWQIADEGGKALLKYTAELRVPIVPNPTVFALLFAEAGNTWLSFQQANPFAMKRSVGIGARVFMPMIGIIGFDYGYGFDRIDAYGNPDPKWKMHFVFGRSF
ncbi:outer membrane protein assembly factor BamA [candidate division KSB1 bacterium]|nr:outer membrane protein assembly factor BamA [candidate division KSB1 bacterium]RQW07533.1 MAG: outer membrane protein assembly factor BamA [candidate division KSB1 bacterium]